MIILRFVCSSTEKLNQFKKLILVKKKNVDRLTENTSHRNSPALSSKQLAKMCLDFVF